MAFLTICHTAGILITVVVSPLCNVDAFTALSLSTTQARDISSLNDWANENGVRFHQNVGLVSSSTDDSASDDWGVSLMDASQVRMERGTSVLTVPSSLVLSSTRVAKELVQEHSLDIDPSMTILDERGFTNQRAEFLLFVKILMEVARENDSLWQPWLQSLPRTFKTGVYMDSFEKSCLPPFAFALAEFETEKLSAFCKALSVLIEQPAAAEPSLSSLKALASKEANDDLIKWSYNVVCSRCWKYADQLEDAQDDNDGIGRSDIVPLGDMFNHADPANVVVNYQDDANNDDQQSRNAVKFVLTHDIETNDENASQLCLSYGLTTNPYRFLILFGFVNDQMKELYCQVLFTNPSKEMVELGCNDRSKMVYGTENGDISTTVWNAVLYSLLEQQSGNTEAEAMKKAFYQAHLDGDTATMTKVRAKYFLEICLTLRNHVVRTSREFEELVGKVNTIIEASGDMSLVEKEHPHLGIIHQHNRFILGVFQKVQNRLEAFVKKEMTRRRQEMAETQQQK